MILFTDGTVSSDPSSVPDMRQIQLFTNNCIQCHGRKNTGAPMIGMAEDWSNIVTQGEDKMLENVVVGIGGMPPLGYCSACSTEDLKVLIRLVANIPAEKGN